MSEIGDLVLLEKLELASNSLTDSIPEEIGNRFQLQRLVIQANQPTGTIPNIFACMENLDTIVLADNNLSGEIPASIWHSGRIAILLQLNNVTGSVPDNACESIRTLKVDNSPWFRDEGKVDCSCCGNLLSSFRIISNNSKSETVQPSCPSSNIRKLHFKESYWIRDEISNETLREVIGVNSEETVAFCFSPTGCYSSYENEVISSKYNLMYNDTSKSLQEQNDCGTVEVCGRSFGQYHEQRNALNHLTQTFELALVENTTENFALCSVMRNPSFNENDIHDGTLLQRYVSMLVVLWGLDEPKLGYNHECDFDIFECDQNKYIQEIKLGGEGLNGAIPSAIGLLTRLRKIDFSRNKLEGTLDPILFSNMPFLEEIYFEENDLGGTLPKSLFELPKLKMLNLGNNSFVGTLPETDSHSRSLSK